MAVSAGYLTFGAGSTLLVRVEDVVLRLHSLMARRPAVYGTRISRELVRCRFVVEHRVSPSAVVLQKSFAVLLHNESLLKDVWHIHDERSFRALLRLPLELRDLGAIRERLAITRDTVL